MAEAKYINVEITPERAVIQLSARLKTGHVLPISGSGPTLAMAVKSLWDDWRGHRTGETLTGVPLMRLG